MDEAARNFPAALEGVLDPREHDLLVAHETQRQQFESAAQSARMPHAWLLQGPLGVGKASLAWHYARQLAYFGEITDQTLPPEVMARFARGSQNLIHDITLPADEKGGFKTQVPIESIRNLNEKLSYREEAQNWRVVIIDPAEALNTSAANALLKLLEEPPEKVLFFLISHAPHKLLPTILSRCQKLRFQELSLDEMREIWPHVTHADLPDEARLDLAEGSIRMALSQTDKFTKTYARMVGMIAPSISRTAIVENSKEMSQTDRVLAFEQCKALFQLLFGRLLRVGMGMEAGMEAEQNAARLIQPIKSNWAALSQSVQAQIDEAERLNLDLEVTILDIWFSIDKILRTS